MFDIIKIFIEEPNKINKVGYNLLRILLNIVFSSKLYIWLFGNYSIINIFDFKDWVEFTLNGTLFICIIIYCISYFVLYILLPIFSTELLKLLISKFVINSEIIIEKSFINWFLNFINVIKINKSTGQISATDHTQSFYEVIESYQEVGTQDEIDKLKNSYLTKILHTYFVFILLYFFIFEIKSRFLTITIILTFTIITIVYLEVCLVVEYLNKESQELSYLLKGILIEQKIPKIFNDKGYDLTETIITEINQKLFYFFHKGRYFIMFYYFRKKDVPGYIINDCYKIIKSTEKNVLLFTNKKMSENAEEKSKHLKDSLSVIHFSDEEDLINKIDKFVS